MTKQVQRNIRKIHRSAQKRTKPKSNRNTYINVALVDEISNCSSIKHRKYDSLYPSSVIFDLQNLNYNN